jgi:hypothetical protein
MPNDSRSVKELFIAALELTNPALVHEAFLHLREGQGFESKA